MSQFAGIISTWFRSRRDCISALWPRDMSVTMKQKNCLIWNQSFQGIQGINFFILFYLLLLFFLELAKSFYLFHFKVRFLNMYIC